MMPPLRVWAIAARGGGGGGGDLQPGFNFFVYKFRAIRPLAYVERERSFGFGIAD
jgi:hypothetical protein